MTFQGCLFHEGNKLLNLAIYPRKTSLTLIKLALYARNHSFLPKIDPICRFQLFPRSGKFISFSKFFRCLDEEKSSSNLPWLVDFANLLSEHVLRIKIKSHKVWASQSKSFKKSRYESGDPDLKRN